MEVEVVDLRLRDRKQAETIDFRAEKARYKCLENFVTNLAVEPPLDDARWDFARAKAGNPCQPLIFVQQLVGLLLNHSNRDFDRDFALAGFVHCRRSVF